MTSAHSTVVLLQRARSGDRQALDALFARYLVPLSRWAAGRLPGYARDLLETHDVIQDVLLQTLRHVEGFESRHEGALQAYLRQAVLNRIRDEIRRIPHRPVAAPLESNHPDGGPSPLEAAIGREAIERYEAALGRLKDEEREAIVARIELGCSYQQIAVVLDKPSAEAARKTVQRAIVRLAEEMRRGA